MKCKKTGKVRYKTHATALKGTQYLLKKGERLESLDVFKCDHCGYWHIGHHYRTNYEFEIEKIHGHIDKIMVKFRQKLKGIHTTYKKG